MYLLFSKPSLIGRRIANKAVDCQAMLTAKEIKKRYGIGKKRLDTMLSAGQEQCLVHDRFFDHCVLLERDGGAGERT